MTEECVAQRVRINGIVQGVGFRPFIYQLANQYNLKGEVANTSAGVAVHIEGPPTNIASFSKDISLKCPPLAHITEISVQDDRLKPLEGFSIVNSQGKGDVSTKGFQVQIRPLDVDRDPAGRIGDVTLQPVLLRQPVNEGPEADALNDTVDSHPFSNVISRHRFLKRLR